MPEPLPYKDVDAVRAAFESGQLSEDAAIKILQRPGFATAEVELPEAISEDEYEKRERQMRATVKAEDAQRAKEEAEGPGFWDRIANALYRGYQGYRQTTMDPYSDPDKADFADISEAAAIQQNLPMGKGLREFYQSEGFGESVKNLFAHDYGGTLLELVAESMGSYFPTVFERAPTRVAAGAAIGAGVGATALGAGAGPGALTGAGWGATATFGDAALALEYSNLILGGLQEEGIDVTNAKALETAFSNEEIMGDLRTRAIKGGIPVALFDMFSARIGGRFLAGAKKKGTSKAVAGTKEMVTQGSLGAAGEVSKSVVLGEEISAPGVVGEFFGEGPTSILEIATGYLEKTAKDKKAPKPEPEKGYVDVPTPEEWEKIPIENADESLDNLLDQVEAPKPDIQEKAEDVNQAQAEEKETKPEPTPEPAKEPVKDKKPEAETKPAEVPEATPEQQQQSAKEEVERATEQAADQPDPDSIAANQKVFDALHKYARLAKKRGKTLEQWASENGVEINDAIIAAWEDADNETPSRIEDMPPEVNTGLGDNNVRNRALKFANADLSDETLGGVSNVGYERRSNEDDAEFAQRDIEERTLSGAVIFEMADEQMPPATKTVYQAELLQRLRDDEKKANAEGDKAREELRQNEQIQLIESINKASTVAGQFLQAFNHFSKLSVGGMLKYAKNKFNAIAGKKIGQATDAINRVRDTLREVEEEVVQQVIAENEEKLIANDPRVKEATRKQVGNLIANEENPETAEVVRQHYGQDNKTPLPQKLENSGMDPKKAKREARRIESKYKRVHAKVSSEIKQRAKGVLKKMPLWKRYKNETVAKLARAVNPATKETATPALQRFTQRLANNFRKHMESLRPERKASIDKLTDEQILAEGITNLEKYEQVWLDTQQELYERENLTPEQVAQLDEVFKEGSPLPFSASTMDRAIRSAQVRLGQDISNVVKQSREEQGGARRNVVEDIVQRTGLTGKGAELLTRLLNKRYLELARRKKKTALKRLSKTDGAPIPVSIKRQYEKIIEWSNLGAFSDAQFDEELAKRLELPHLTEELKKKIMRQARVVESKPEGFQKQREAVKLMNLIAGEKTFGAWDIFWDLWFANVLAGLSTQTINLLGSAQNLLAHTIINFMRRPGDLGTMIQGIARGMVKGINEGAAVLSTGIVTGTRLDKYQQGKNLELITKWRFGKFNPLAYLKYVGRALATGDMLFFKVAEEMKQSILARNVAKKEGLSGKALYRRTQEILNNTKEQREKATRQADAEGLTGLDRRRRIAELMEEGRPQPEEAKSFAMRVIFTNKPYGFLGLLAEAVNKINAKVPAFQMVAPFVNIVSNVTNESLNYFPPIGYMRYRQGVRKGQLYGQPLSEDTSVRKDQLGDQFAKVTLGAVSMVSVGSLAWSMKDDDDPWFMMHGSGPRDYGKNKTWRATGALPYSMKIGDTYLPYKDTVMAIPFSLVGSMMDAYRFNGMQDENIIEIAALGMTYTAGVVAENSFLKGMLATSSIVNQKLSGERATKVIWQQASRTGAAALVPFAGLLRDVDRLFDPTRYDGTDIKTMTYSQIPFVRRLNKPTLNVLGEPVEMHVSDRYWSTPRASEELRWLVEKNAYPSFPNKNSTVNVRGRDMDPDEFYDYIKMSGEGIRARIKSDLFPMKRFWDRQPSDRLKLAVDDIVRDERKKAKVQLYRKYK